MSGTAVNLPVTHNQRQRLAWILIYETTPCWPCHLNRPVADVYVHVFSPMAYRAGLWCLSYFCKFVFRVWFELNTRQSLICWRLADFKKQQLPWISGFFNSLNLVMDTILQQIIHGQLLQTLSLMLLMLHCIKFKSRMSFVTAYLSGLINLVSYTRIKRPNHKTGIFLE